MRSVTFGLKGQERLIFDFTLVSSSFKFEIGGAVTKKNFPLKLTLKDTAGNFIIEFEKGSFKSTGIHYYALFSPQQNDLPGDFNTFFIRVAGEMKNILEIRYMNEKPYQASVSSDYPSITMNIVEDKGLIVIDAQTTSTIP